MKQRILFIATIFTIGNSINAQWFKKSKPQPTAPAEQADKKGKLESIDSKTKNCQKLTGIFTLYRDTNTGQVFMVINKTQFNQDYIHFTYTENGVIEAGHNRGSYRGSRIFKIKKSYNNIEFEQQNTSFYFDPTNPISKSANANISNAPLAFEKIIAEDKKTGDYLIDADELFLTEKLHQVKAGGRPGSEGFKLGNLTKGKTQYTAVKNYPENADFMVRYVYDNPSPMADGSAEVTDARSVVIELQHSFIAVPKNNFTPRRDDFRIGYFSEQINDMTTTGVTNYKDLIHRWNLEKKDPTAAKSEPVKPITWWIENTTPKSIRPIIKHAALQWNMAFEPLGFINAVEILEQPDTAKWDAGDIRYNVLRWTSSPQPPFGGYGPSFVNPKTGEILGADIMLEYIFLTNRVKLENVFNVEGESAEGHAAHEGCDAGLYLHHQQMVAKNLLQISDNNEEELSRLLQESIHYLVLHEMGHTMGLMHNMKASNLHTPEELLDRELTMKTGLIGSVMDYPAVNLPPADKKVKVQYCQTEPGPYDYWAIEYGYSIGSQSPSEEEKRLTGIAERSIEKALAFGNDADDMRSPGKAIDPKVMINDLSSDAITLSANRIELAKSLMPDLVKKYGNNKESYQELVSAFNMLSGAYASNIEIVSRYIGGVYVQRSSAGQANAPVPMQAVPYKEQKRAMEVLAKYAFAPNAMEFPEEIVNKLQQQRRGFGFFATGEDPKLHSRVLRMQGTILSHLLSSSVLMRLTDSKYLGNTYSANEMMNDLTKSIFAEDLTKSVNTHRRMLQILYTERLIAMLEPARSQMFDPISKSAIFSQMLGIQKMMKANIGTDVETSAHRVYVQNLIEKALKD